MKTSSGQQTTAQAWSMGTVVALCGIDGSGKSTLAAGLAAALRSEGHAVVCTRQPTSFYRSSRHVREYHDEGSGEMWEEGLALLSATDRLLHLRSEVVPALEAGSIVICDRFLLATLAIFAARGVDVEWLREINRYCPQPHVTVLLDCPSALARARIEQRGGYIRLEERSAARLERIRRSYLELVPDDALVLDAALPRGTLVDAALAMVRARLSAAA